MDVPCKLIPADHLNKKLIIRSKNKKYKKGGGRQQIRDLVCVYFSPFLKTDYTPKEKVLW